MYATDKTAPAPSGGRSRRESPKPELQSRLQTPFSTQENDQETMRNPSSTQVAASVATKPGVRTDSTSGLSDCKQQKHEEMQRRHAAVQS